MDGLFTLYQGDQLLLSEKRLTDQKIKLNCWEFKKCGREPGGTNASQRETCPAAVESRADGIHNGLNGGRCCWAVTAALRQQGISLEQSGMGCNGCDFYRLVRNEEEQRLTLRYIQPAPRQQVNSL